jgi:hypothetical protein
MKRLQLSDHASWPDVDKSIEYALYNAHHNPEELTLKQSRDLAQLAEAYIHILTHPAGTESIIKQVREARRLWKQSNYTVNLPDAPSAGTY